MLSYQHNFSHSRGRFGFVIWNFSAYAFVSLRSVKSRINLQFHLRIYIVFQATENIADRELKKIFLLVLFFLREYWTTTMDMEYIRSLDKW